MKCSVCDNQFEAGTVVMVPEGQTSLAVCSEACQRAYDAQRKQQTLTPLWSAYVYGLEAFDEPCATVTKIQSRVVAKSHVVEVVISMPGGASMDQLNEFIEEVASLSLSRHTLTPLRQQVLEACNTPLEEAFEAPLLSALEEGGFKTVEEVDEAEPLVIENRTALPPKECEKAKGIAAKALIAKALKPATRVN